MLENIAGHIYIVALYAKDADYNLAAISLFACSLNTRFNIFPLGVFGI